MPQSHQPVKATSRSPSRKPAEVDWDLAALLLARGHGMAETALIIGVSRTTLWRTLSRMPALTDAMDARQAEATAENAARLAAMRGKITDQIESKVDAGDTRVLLWMAKQLGLVGVPAALGYRAMARDSVLSETEQAELTRAAFAEEPATTEAGPDRPNAPAAQPASKPVAAANVSPLRKTEAPQALSLKPPFQVPPQTQTATAACALFAQSAGSEAPLLRATG